MKDKVTVLYIQEEKLPNGARREIARLIGDKPTDEMAKQGIGMLLEYVKRIGGIR